MAKCILLMTVIFCSTAFSKTYFYVTNGKKTRAEFFEKDGLILSGDCKHSNCQAVQASRQKPNTPDATTGTNLLGNPAALYCSNHDAKSVILKDAKGNEDSFCEFSDGSLVESWGLYNKFH